MCEGCYPRLVPGSRVYSCIYLQIVVVVFGACVISGVLLLSKFVRERVACVSDYVPYVFGALFVCLIRRDGCCGLEYLSNFAGYMWWVLVRVVCFFRI